MGVRLGDLAAKLCQWLLFIVAPLEKCSGTSALDNLDGYRMLRPREFAAWRRSGAQMRKFNIPVFDDFISGSGTTVTTRPELNDRLAEVDKLALFAVTDQVTTTGTLTVRVQHSGDGINWVNKSETAEINGEAIATSTTNTAYGSDSGATPSLGFVRLSITITTSTLAHVTMWVTGRDES